MENQPLLNKKIAIPETRQLDVLAGLLERRGATVLRCPLVAILDAPDPEPIANWLARFNQNQFDDLIIYTGEGIRRLRSFAERAGLYEAFVASLKTVRKIARGPKPAKALKEMGLTVDITAKAPTTDGIIATLDDLSFDARQVAVQIYGQEPNQVLMQYLDKRNIQANIVAPYIYAPEVDENKVLNLIDELATGAIDAMVFTSQPQYKRLQAIAKKADKLQVLQTALQTTLIAAVGPVVAKQLEDAGVAVNVMPEQSFFMKPLVTEIVAAIGDVN